MPVNPAVREASVRRWAPLMREVRDAWPVDAERPALSLWAALIDAESAGDPNAVSPQGAVGLGQVMPSDHASYTPALRAMFHGRPTATELRDPRTNLEWSLRILITLGYRRCGSWDSALMAYFTGRCDAPTARDATGTSGAQYVRAILERRRAYRDLDAPAARPSAPSAPTTLTDVARRLARLEARVEATAHTHEDG